MRQLLILCTFIVACGPPPTGTLSSKVSRDPALATTFTTEDGWTLNFTHVVIAISGVSAKGGEDVGFPAGLAKPKVVDLVVGEGVDLVSNAMATPKAYDTVALALGRATGDENVNVPADVLNRMGQRPFYVEGTASKQSTMRTFQLGSSKAVTFSGCMPSATVAANGTATLDFRVHAQRVFHDDAGKMRFEAWALADTAPVDTVVVNTEAQTIMTSTLPPAHYGMTQGNLITVFEKRLLGIVGLGDSGTCTGQ